jgi:sterol desaturase/sphingolipid hydroxylase (fatty acid hydroxylase superfamily)
MPPALFATTTVPLPDLSYIKMAAAILFLALFWCWETWRPFFAQQEGRARHALHNLAVALFNTVILGLAFGFVTAAVAGWTAGNQLGLLNSLAVPGPVRFGLALVLLDGWMYLWHRANHTIPILWRFHRVHHSDRRMDVAELVGDDEDAVCECNGIAGKGACSFHLQRELQPQPDGRGVRQNVRRALAGGP